MFAVLARFLLSMVITVSGFAALISTYMMGGYSVALIALRRCKHRIMVNGLLLIGTVDDGSDQRIFAIGLIRQVIVY